MILNDLNKWSPMWYHLPGHVFVIRWATEWMNNEKLGILKWGEQTEWAFISHTNNTMQFVIPRQFTWCFRQQTEIKVLLRYNKS